MRSTLIEMLTYRRPMGSATENAFRTRYLLSLKGAYVDEHKNIHVRVGESRTLWSSHTDTVHTRDGYQSVIVDERQIARLGKDETTPVPVRAVAPILVQQAGRKLSRRERKRLRRASNGVYTLQSPRTCLGADDTVGVYLMREMILQAVPGYYVFHYGEERGGIGSSALARTHAAYLSAHFDRAIALDRQGYNDIITHQFGMCTASEYFACALGDAMQALDSGLKYGPAIGVYTDTAEYAECISECTNLSVGYAHQHSSSEVVDLRHVDRLLGVLCDLRPDDVPAMRDPRVQEPEVGIGTGMLRGWDDLGFDYAIKDALDADYIFDEDDPAYATGVDAPFWSKSYKRKDTK
jgi:hypothetical protein